MLITAIILFVFAAVFGLMALLPILKNEHPSKSVALLHGAIAAVALVLVIVATVSSTGPAPTTSLIIFVAAAVGGFLMFAMDMQKKPIPKLLAVGHPILAAVGLITLILYVMS